MTIRFIRSSEKRRIEKELEEQFGIQKLQYLLLGTGKERIRAFSGSLSKEEIAELAHIVNIELIGTYMLKQEHEFRLSFDACHLLKGQINKNIVELNDDEFHKWIRGHDIQKDAPQGTYIVSYKGDFYGCGKSNGKVLFNYIPKDRRIKN